MDFKHENRILTIFLEGRLDANNADVITAQTEEICKSQLAENTAENLVLDAENLDYISSAGLRMVLKLRKQYETMRVVNVSAEIYDIFEMTGFTEMITIEKAYRRFCVDGCPIIGQGAKGTVYRYNEDTIVKVYKNPDSLPDIQNERKLARRAFVLGIPTAISYDVVRVGENYGSVFELLQAKSYSQLINEDPENRDKYIEEYALLLKKIHATVVKEDDMPNIKVFVRDWLGVSAPFLASEDAEKIGALIDDAPDTLTMLHCDYHTNNVMSQNGEALLIDMDTLSHGHPIFELANIYITYVGFGEEDPTVVEKFLGMPYETAVYIWKKFLPTYLGTEDASVIADVEKKVRLISYLRLLRHTVRRDSESEKSKKTIAFCRANIEKLLPQVDTLDF